MSKPFSWQAIAHDSNILHVEVGYSSFGNKSIEKVAHASIDVNNEQTPLILNLQAIQDCVQQHLASLLTKLWPGSENQEGSKGKKGMKFTSVYTMYQLREASKSEENAMISFP